jgi:hypothetical protein
LGNFSVFEYCYRDASNYKTFGRLLLDGVASDSNIQILRSHFESGEFFIAEQLGIPPLYAELWELSQGPTDDDHVWHTYETLRVATKEETHGEVFGTVGKLIFNIAAVTVWNPRLSPHWKC